MLRRGRREPAIGPPVLICGCGHSGTTLLLSILSAHSRLYCGPYESAFATKAPAEFDWFVRRFNRETRAAGKARWVEKTPRHIYRIRTVLDRFPEARIVVMLRDGRDVACSIRNRIGDFEKGVRRWLDDYAAAEPYFGHDAVHVLKYEDLVADREPRLAAVLDALDESFEPALLEHHTGSFRYLGHVKKSQAFAQQLSNNPIERPLDVTGEKHRSYRSWQASQKVFDGRGRWRRDMTEHEKDVFKDLAGERLVEFGYAADDRW